MKENYFDPKGPAVVVCGSRNWSNKDLLFATLSNLAKKEGFSCIIEGEARGADTLARQWANLHKVPVERFPAQWSRYGKRAGMLRNYDMIVARAPDKLVAFTSRRPPTSGTAHAIKLAKRYGIETFVVYETH